MQNLDDLVQHNSLDYYQIQLNNDTCVIKHVGEGGKMGDIVILENFGKDNKYSIYCCIYEKKELELLENKYIPILRLTDGLRHYCICVKLLKLEYNSDIVNFELYFMHGLTQKHFFPLDKNINTKNAVDTILEISMDKGFLIL